MIYEIRFVVLGAVVLLGAVWTAYLLSTKPKKSDPAREWVDDFLVRQQKK